MRIASLVPADGQRHPRRAPRHLPRHRGPALPRQPASHHLLGPVRIGGVVAVWALAALVRRPRRRARRSGSRAPESAVLRAAARELEQVRRQRQHEGWTSDLAARALAALRLAGSYALGRPVAQIPAAGIQTRAGQVRVPSLLPAPAQHARLRLRDCRDRAAGTAARGSGTERRPASIWPISRPPSRDLPRRPTVGRAPPPTATSTKRWSGRRAPCVTWHAGTRGPHAPRAPHVSLRSVCGIAHGHADRDRRTGRGALHRVAAGHARRSALHPWRPGATRAHRR